MQEDYPQQQQAVLNACISLIRQAQPVSPEELEKIRQMVLKIPQRHMIILQRIVNMLCGQKQGKDNSIISLRNILSFVWLLDIWANHSFSSIFIKFFGEVISLITNEQHTDIIKEIVSMILIKVTRLFISSNPGLQDLSNIAKFQDLPIEIETNIQIQLQPQLSYLLAYANEENFNSLLILFYLIILRKDSLKYLNIQEKDKLAILGLWQKILKQEKNEDPVMQFIGFKILQVFPMRYCQDCGINKFLYGLSLLSIIHINKYEKTIDKYLLYNHHNFFLDGHSNNTSDSKTLEHHIFMLRQQIFKALLHLYMIKGSEKIQNYLLSMMNNQLTTLMIAEIYHLLRPVYCQFYVSMQIEENTKSKSSVVKRIQGLLQHAKAISDINISKCYVRLRSKSHIQRNIQMKNLEMSLKFQIMTASQAQYSRKMLNLVTLRSDKQSISIYLKIIYPFGDDDEWKGAQYNIQEQKCSIHHQLVLVNNSQTKKQIILFDSNQTQQITLVYNIVFEINNGQSITITLNKEKKVKMKANQLKQCIVGSTSDHLSGVKRVTEFIIKNTASKKQKISVLQDLNRKYTYRDLFIKPIYSFESTNGIVCMKNKYESYTTPINPIQLLFLYLLQFLTSETEKKELILPDFIRLICKELVVFDKIMDPNAIQNHLSFLCLSCITLQNQVEPSRTKSQYLKFIPFIITLMYPWYEVSSHKTEKQFLKQHLNEKPQYLEFLHKQIHMLMGIALRANTSELWNLLYHKIIVLSWLEKQINLTNNKTEKYSSFIALLYKEALYLGSLIGFSPSLYNNGHFIKTEKPLSKNRYKRLLKFVLMIQPQYTKSGQQIQHLAFLLKILSINLTGFNSQNVQEMIFMVKCLKQQIGQWLAKYQDSSIEYQSSFSKAKAQITEIINDVFRILPNLGYCMFCWEFQDEDLSTWDSYYDQFINKGIVDIDSDQNVVESSHISEGGSTQTISYSFESQTDSVGSNREKSDKQVKTGKIQPKQDLIPRNYTHQCHKLMLSAYKDLLILLSMGYVETADESSPEKLGIFSRLFERNQKTPINEQGSHRGSSKFMMHIICILGKSKDEFDWDQKYSNSDRISILMVVRATWQMFLKLEEKSVSNQYQPHFKQLIKLDYPIYSPNLVKKIMTVYLNKKYQLIDLNSSLIAQLSSIQLRAVLSEVMKTVKKSNKDNQLFIKLLGILRLFATIRFCFPQEINHLSLEPQIPNTRLKIAFKELLVLNKLLDTIQKISSDHLLTQTIDLSFSKIKKQMQMIHELKSVLESREKLFDLSQNIIKNAQMSNSNKPIISSESFKPLLIDIKNNEISQNYMQKLKHLKDKIRFLNQRVQDKILGVFQSQQKKFLNLIDLSNKAYSEDLQSKTVITLLVTQKPIIRNILTYLYELKELIEDIDRVFPLSLKKNLKKNSPINQRKQSETLSHDKIILEFKPSEQNILSKIQGKYQNRISQMCLSLLSTHTNILSSYSKLAKALDTDQHIQNQGRGLIYQHDYITFGDKFGLFKLDEALNVHKMKYILKKDFGDLTDEEWNRVPKYLAEEYPPHLVCALTLKGQINEFIRILHIQKINSQVDLFDKDKDPYFDTVTLVTIEGVYQGKLKVQKKGTNIIFEESTTINENLYEEMQILSSQRRTYQELLNSRKTINISVREICSAYKKKYLHYYTSIQIYLKYSAYFFVFKSEKNCKDFISLCNIKVEQNHQEELVDRIKDMIFYYKKGYISAFTFLIEINNIGGRSINDPSQYYVFPWVVLQVPRSPTETKKQYRNLQEPIGKINPSKFKIYSQRFKDAKRYDNIGQSPFYYGTFYSNPGFLCNFMLRIKPFTLHHFQLQGGKFDCLDRLFVSYESLSRSVYSNIGDIKQLIPQFYYFPQFMRNRNNCRFGSNQSEASLMLPQWVVTQTPEQFVFKLRKQLENCSKLYSWVELIFGEKSSFQKAQKYENLYNEKLYPNYDVSENKTLCFKMRKQFGQVPQTILNRNYKQGELSNKVTDYIDREFYKLNYYNPSSNNELRQEINGVYGSKILIEGTSIIVYQDKSVKIYDLSSQNKKLLDFDVKGASDIACLKAGGAEEYLLLYLLKSNGQEIEQVIFKEQKGSILNDRKSYSLRNSEVIVTGHSINKIEAHSKYLIWCQANILNIRTINTNIFPQQMQKRNKYLKLQKKLLHHSHITHIVSNNNLNMVVCADRGNMVSVLTIHDLVQIRSVFNIFLMEFNEEIKNIQIHELGIILFLTSLNRIIVHNFYGDLIMAVELKNQIIRDVKFINKQWKSDIVLMTKNELFQVELFDLLNLQSLDSLCFKIEKKNWLKIVRLESLKNTIKLKDFYHRQSPKKYDRIQIMALHKYWMIILLCNDGTMDCLTNSDGCLKAMMEKKLRDLINSDYMYQNMRKNSQH